MHPNFISHFPLLILALSGTSVPLASIGPDLICRTLGQGLEDFRLQIWADEVAVAEGELSQAGESTTSRRDMRHPHFWFLPSGNAKTNLQSMGSLQWIPNFMHLWSDHSFWVKAEEHVKWQVRGSGSRLPVWEPRQGTMSWRTIMGPTK